MASTPLVLYNCVLFILLIQSVVGAQSLNITPLFLSFGTAAVAVVFGTVITL